MRALSDQMEPAPPQVQELRAALAIWKRSAEEWRERAQKAEAEVARLRSALASDDPNVRRAALMAEEMRDAIAAGALAKGGGDESV